MSKHTTVLAWEEPVAIPTYPAPEPDRNPMFLDKRVYQGSSGKVYPNPFTDRISDEKVDKQYTAIHLENEYVRLMILPEIGGRIHVGQDKTNNYDFFYRQRVIKPALVGLAGPWISGGVEFNWPQHHRPSTFMPVEYSIEEHEDGSRTVWLSEHEPMNRMKGMVGICLHPGKSIIEAKVRLYNRTPFVQTFLWWANVGIRVHDQYQAFFPPDVTFVADHAKRAMSWYPVAHNFYYGVDYTSGVDLSWYKNIPVPTSYMVTKSDYDFFGGYDHANRAGIVHVANHHIAPGKKLWTWGNADFGYAWDRELTDADGPYIELMAGVYTDNQPDFSWLQPYETKTFSQFWYPIRDIGPAKNANRSIAVNLERANGGWRIGASTSERFVNANVRLTAGDEVLLDVKTNISPSEPFVVSVSQQRPCEDAAMLLSVSAEDGRELIRYRPVERTERELPQAATEPPEPERISSNEELYLTGVHLEQYRHATRSPEAYWTEAIRREPDDARANNALGLQSMRRGDFREAEQCFRRAVGRLTRRNPNPYDGEPYYNLGLSLRYQSRDDEAYGAFYKATWNQAWQAPAYYELAAIDCRRSDYGAALEHADRALRTNVDHLKARNLKAHVLRILGREAEASEVVRGTSELDPLDFWAKFEAALLAGGGRQHLDALFTVMRNNAGNVLDLAFDLLLLGSFSTVADLLEAYQAGVENDAYLPTVRYTLAHTLSRLGDLSKAEASYRKARETAPDYCFPVRLEEMLVLEAAIAHDADDARAHYYLGNLLYDKGRRREAIVHWENACRLEPDFSVPWRNLGIACYNIEHNAARALSSYENARRANPADARLLYEMDQLRKRTGANPHDRLRILEADPALVNQRDDLTVELVTLYNQMDQSERALEILTRRRFHPWEGGEGLVSGQYAIACLQLGCRALKAGDFAEALRHFVAARTYPQNLGEGKHLLLRETHIDFLHGFALSNLGKKADADALWIHAAESGSQDTTYFEYYRGMALRALGRESEATQLFGSMRKLADERMNTDVKIDYFATSLPNFLIFEDDLEMRNRADGLFLRGLARIGLGDNVEGIADLSSARELDPNHFGVQFELNLAPEIAAALTPETPPRLGIHT